MTESTSEIGPVSSVEAVIAAGMTVEAFERVRRDLNDLNDDVNTCVITGLVAEDDGQERERRRRQRRAGRSSAAHSRMRGSAPTGATVVLLAAAVQYAAAEGEGHRRAG